MAQENVSMAGPTATQKFLESLMSTKFALRMNEISDNCNVQETEFDLIRLDLQAGILGTVKFSGVTSLSNITIADESGNEVGLGKLDSFSSNGVLSFSYFFDICQTKSADASQNFVTFTNPSDASCNNMSLHRTCVNDKPFNIEYRSVNKFALIASLDKQYESIVVTPGRSCSAVTIGFVLASALREFAIEFNMFQLTNLPMFFNNVCCAKQCHPLDCTDELIIRASCRDQLFVNSKGVATFGRVHVDIIHPKPKRVVYIVELLLDVMKFHGLTEYPDISCKRTNGSDTITVHSENGCDLGSYTMCSKSNPSSTAKLAETPVPYMKVRTQAPVSVHPSEKYMLNDEPKCNLEIISALNEKRVLAKINCEFHVVKIRFTDEKVLGDRRRMILAFCTHLALFYFRLPGQLLPHRAHKHLSEEGRGY
ncbi:hypothetical protein EB796_015289 [Bugula neritina]|uniref:Uncharacterized protein n=1 Tax=Bugula neritina TaxID=10212 RepID=A0A7J7JL76_BUGNE|nr:hypothetical protein EB796_015289 [Bugula neritina]